MNKGIVIGAIVAFCVPIGFILCQSALRSDAEDTAKKGKKQAKGELLYFYSPS